jgi:hypothetical protein
VEIMNKIDAEAKRLLESAIAARGDDAALRGIDEAAVQMLIDSGASPDVVDSVVAAIVTLDRWKRMAEQVWRNEA